MTSTASLRLTSSAPEATQAIAGKVALHFQPGDIVSLTGELGAGKTCFVQGAARALGVADRVKSPSFLLRRDYVGRIPVTHMDVYRLATFEEFAQVGQDDPDAHGGVTFIEWGDTVAAMLLSDFLEIEVRMPDLEEPDERVITLRSHGEQWTNRVRRIQSDCRQWVLS